MLNFEFNADIRGAKGTKASRGLRRQEIVPAVVYGAGQEPQKISLSHQAVWRALENEAFYSHILTLKVAGKNEQVILKDMHRHPFKSQIMHMDFMRINANQKLTMHVPLHIVGEDKAPGIKEGGVMSKLMNDLSIRCLPADLPEYIELNVAALGIGESLHLSDIKLPKGVEFVTEVDEEHNHPVVSIHVSKVSSDTIEEGAPVAGITEVLGEVEAAAAEAEAKEGKE
jgi:large subunit ribosomal protein L25